MLMLIDDASYFVPKVEREAATDGLVLGAVQHMAREYMTFL